MRRSLALAAIAALLPWPSVALLGVGVAQAASVSSAVFSGAAGTVTVGGTVYAKKDAVLTLTVATSNDTKCVAVTGAATLPRQTSSQAKTSWTFTTTAPGGNGVQAFTIAASPDFNNKGECTGKTESGQASYTLDNTGPVVKAELTPAPNTAGWNNSDVTVSWNATDAGSGVVAAQPFKEETVTANGIVTMTAPAQSDRLGHTGSEGSQTVRVDKAKPTITAAQIKNSDGTTTVTFTCADSNSGGGEASGIASCIADGSTTNSKTVQPGVTVTGTAIDRAGNKATESSIVSAGDTTAPVLTGKPSTTPNSLGWYKGDVTINWTASDPESGIPAQPVDTTISAEGQDLTSTLTVKNGAGLTTTATSSPAVKIDRTAPTTGTSGTSNTWVNNNVTLTLAPNDNLSGIASTSYTVNGGPSQTGTSVALSTEGEHTITYFSTDKAGNAEAAQTVTVKIDKTAPTIGHTFTPLSYKNGAWTNQDVKVTFECADQGGSGMASCTEPVTKTTEGEGQEVVGRATDNAGNWATNTAVVSIDMTKPTITAKADRTANTAGWYNDDVTVSYAATDALSGVSGTPANDILREGANQSASATVTDAAGNTATAGVTGINVDKTAPVLSGTFASGWHTGDVTVDWSCTDALSDPAAQPAADVVKGEGANLTSTASCTDKAGNDATKTVSGIQIDRTAPTTASHVDGTLKNGWYGGAVKVTLTGTDNLSGVAGTSYSVDGGETQPYTGAFSFDTEGEHKIAFWSKDRAGNVERAGAPITLKIDKTAPTTTVINPISPDSGWFVTSGIPFAFEAKDAGSGIGATYYTINGGARHTYGEAFNVDLSTGSHTVKYWSVDLAGNPEAEKSLTLRVDTVAPEIKGSQTPAANSFGWNNGDVSVEFKCTDADSGIDGVAGCAGNTTLVNEGAGQKVKGDAVDVAGNRSSTEFGPVNIDKTKPTLSGGATTAPNAAGWYKGDVTVAWTGQDALSGINPATQPANSTVTGEGPNLTAGPKTIADKAGNVSDPASVSGIKIDRTNPVISDERTTQPNAAGWYSSGVTVKFSCTDALSGCEANGAMDGKSLLSDGANQSVTSTPAEDFAGNVTAGKTVGGINIDSKAPQTTADNRCDGKNGWCKGQTATVVLSATDQAGLSGVKEIRYTVNGGQEKVAAGNTAEVLVPLAARSGTANVTYHAVDNAGNAEPSSGVALKYDNIAPTVTHTLSAPASSFGWHKDNVLVDFDAKDDDGGSGLDPAVPVGPDTTVSAETAATGRVITGSAADLVGNVGTDSVTVKLDRTAPTITAAVSGTKGDGDWYTGPVTVKFTCADTLSGLAVTCPADEVLTANGRGLSVTGTVVDKAGNTASAKVDGLNIDSTKPEITIAGVKDGGIHTLGAVPAASCSATDNLSTSVSCNVATTGGKANGVGTFTYTATAKDAAGNTQTTAGTYKVIYKWEGFRQPINDTAHQVGTSTSIFKAGSTVPAKLQLKKADGTAVQANADPTWLTPVKGSTTAAAVDETLYTDSPTAGGTYRWDATGSQYQYNWGTPKASAGNYWRAGVTLDDGQTYYVNLGLR